jgi:hypothetical protein
MVGKELDSEAEEIWEFEDPGHGDEFMAVVPWKGQVREPTSHPAENNKIPDERWVMDFVYGFKSEDARMNLFYNATGKPVYMAAALGLILDQRTRR